MCYLWSHGRGPLQNCSNHTALNLSCFWFSVSSQPVCSEASSSLLISAERSPIHLRMAACLWNILKAGMSIQQPLRHREPYPCKLFSWETGSKSVWVSYTEHGTRQGEKVHTERVVTRGSKHGGVSHLSTTLSSQVTTNLVRMIHFGNLDNCTLGTEYWKLWLTET